MNQCVVPSWDIDDGSALPRLSSVSAAPSNSSNSLPSHVPSLDYEVAELKWENGQLVLHGLGPPRVVNKPSPTTWEKPRAAGAGTGTLESIVSQATCHQHAKPAKAYELVPWFDHRRAAVNPTAVTTTMDALVPNNNTHNHNNNDGDNNNNNNIQENSGTPATGIVGTCMVGSCSATPAGGAKTARRRGTCGCGRANASVSESATCGGRDSRRVTLDASEREYLGGAGLTSPSLWSPENTSSGKEYTKTSAGEDHDHSVCHSRSEGEAGEEEGKKIKTVGRKSSISTKRSRAAAIHNQSERKRRDKINQRMKTLQKLVPNCSKTDKASMLDEVIEYLKQLQAQVQMMSRLNMPSMMLPLAMQQQLQMSMMGMGMGMGVMDINSIGAAAAGMQPVMPPATAFMPMAASWPDVSANRLPSSMMMPNDFLSAVLACQSQQQQPMTMDAYSRLASLYQQFQQPPAPGSNN